MADDAVIQRNSDKATQDEADAAVVVTPGELLERRTGGDYGPHSVDGGPASPVFAGLGVDPNLEKTDDVPADARFYLWHVPRGSGVHVEAIAGTGGVSENDYVVSGGDGRLTTFAAGDEGAVIGQATEDAAAGEKFTVEV